MWLLLLIWRDVQIATDLGWKYVRYVAGQEDVLRATAGEQQAMYQIIRGVAEDMT